MAVTQAEIDLIARDKTAPAFRDAIANANRLTDNVRKSHREVAAESTTAFGRVQEGIEKARGSLESFGALVGVAIGVETLREGVKSYAEVDTAIRRIGINSGKTREQVDEAFEGIDKTVVKTGVNAEALRKSFHDLTLVEGWDEAQKHIGTVAEIVRATGASVEDTTNLVIRMQNSFGVAGDKIIASLAGISAGMRYGRIEQKDMVKALADMGVEAAQLGMKGPKGVNEFVAALQAMSLGTTHAEDAIASMGELIQHISSRGKGLDMMNKLIGTQTLQHDIGNALADSKSTITVFLDDVNKAVDYLADQRRMNAKTQRLTLLKEIFPNKPEMALAINAFLANRDLFDRAVQEMNAGRGFGQMEKDAAEMSKGVQKSLDELSEKWKLTGEKLGQGLVDGHILDSLIAAIDGTTAALKWLDKTLLGPGIKSFYELTHPPVEARRGPGPASTPGGDAFRILHGHPAPSPYGSLPGRGTFGVQQDQGQQQIPGSARPVIQSDPGSTTEATAKAQLAALEQVREILRRMPGGDGSTPGGGGGGATPGGHPGGGKYNVGAAYNLIKAAGGSDEEARTLAAISQAESGGSETAHNTKGRDNSYGLWQINMLGAMGPQRRAQYGLKSNEELFDPATNARVALEMHRRAGGYRDWTTYTSGAYAKYLGGESGRAAETATPPTSPKRGETPTPPPKPQSSLQVDQHLADLEALRRKASEPIRTKIAFDYEDSALFQTRRRGGAEARREFGNQVKRARDVSYSDVGVGSVIFAIFANIGLCAMHAPWHIFM